MTASHVEGNLNFSATRNGWTRNFTLTPEQVSKIDYSTLETILELQTIKAARSSLFIEHPAGSGTFVKIRPWKSNDGSLQSALMHEFFDERMQSGTVTTIDVRDSQDAGRQAGKAGDWLRAHGLAVTQSSTSGGTSSEGEVTEDGQPVVREPKSQPGSFFGGLFRAPPAPSTPPTSPPTENPALPPDPAESQAKEEEILRERGWQPMLRRLTTKRRKTKKDKETTDIQAEGDGEEIQIPEGEEANERPDKNGKWPKYPKFLKGKKDKEKETSEDAKDKEGEKEKEKIDEAEPAAQVAQDAEAPATPAKDSETT